MAANDATHDQPSMHAPAILTTGIAPDRSEHRRRLLEGMASAVAHQGYGEVTIADIVAEANVSRRTFYEHFDSKADCLMALYVSASRHALQVLRDAIDPRQPWTAQVEGAMRAYLGYMAGNPTLLRTLFIEILSLGGPGLAVRRQVHRDLAEFIQRTVGTDQRRRQRLPYESALALVGAVHELVLERIEGTGPARLETLVPTVCDLVRRIVGEEGRAAS